MDTCQNSIHSLLEGWNIINLLIMMNIEISFKYDVLLYATPVK
jgi:hypothetical protein